MDRKKFEEFLQQHLEGELTMTDVKHHCVERELVTYPEGMEKRVVTLKTVEMKCLDCDRSVKDRPHKRHRYHGNGYWSHYCKTCKMFYNADTDRWDTPNPQHAKRLNAAVDDEESNHTDEDQDQGTA